LESDQREIARLAGEHDFAVLKNASQPFDLWDGRAWRLKRLG
jgi:hypothetical protein